MTNPVPEDLGDYVELQCASHFSLLRGASSPGELFDEAQRLGYRALAICDRNSLAGMVAAVTWASLRLQWSN